MCVHDNYQLLVIFVSHLLIVYLTLLKRKLQLPVNRLRYNTSYFIPINDDTVAGTDVSNIFALRVDFSQDRVRSCN